MLARAIFPKGRILVVGDIHGNFQTLFALLKKIKFSQKDALYQLGDLIDRGPESKRVVDYARQLVSVKRMIALRGNHEQMLLHAVDDPRAERKWYDKRGGRATLDSFGVDSVAEIPKPYLRWFNKMPAIVKIPYDDGKTYVLSHAGIDTKHPKPFRNTDANLNHVIWNRNAPVKVKSTYINVVGHTVKTITEIRHSLKTGTIYLDGGCGHGGNLVALDLGALTLEFVRNCDK